METYLVLRDLAIIIIAAKVCGIIARKLHAPQVVGQIIAGLLIGPCVLGFVSQTDFLMQMAEVGVILLMFSAGLETCLCRCICAHGSGSCFLYDVLWICTMGIRGIL